MAYNRNGYYKRARIIQEITRKHFEPERQDLAAVWRKHIRDAFGMCYDTYLKYLHTEIPAEVPEPTDKQLSLFDD